MLEVDLLVNLEYVIRAFETKSRRATTTTHGRSYLSDKLALWQTAASFHCMVLPEGELVARYGRSHSLGCCNGVSARVR
jgi:hypothetical protein